MLLKILWLVVIPFLASAQKKINLAPVLPSDSVLRERHSYLLVKQGNVLFKRFTTEFGVLDILDSQPLRKDTIDAGKCARSAALAGEAKEKGQEELVQARVRIADSDWSAFGGLIQATVKDKCSENQIAQKQWPALDLGVSKTVTGKDGSRTTYRIYNQNLGTNLNFGMQF